MGYAAGNAHINTCNDTHKQSHIHIQSFTHTIIHTYNHSHITHTTTHTHTFPITNPLSQTPYHTLPTPSQIAKLKGCHVVAVARGAEKTQLLRDMGADVVLNSNMLVSTEGVPKENVQGGGVQGGGAQGGKGGEVLLSKAIRTAVPGGTGDSMRVTHY